jgi:predicted MFS family arabinose efflux permease
MLVADSRSDAAHRTFDIPGAVTVTAGLSILVYALVDAESAGWGSTQTIGLLALSAVLLGAFLVIESRSRGPLLPLSIFRLRTLSASNGVGLLIGMSLFSMFFFISLYLQQVLHYDALKAGFAYLPLALLIIVSAGVASQLVTRIGFKPTLIAGLGLITVALLWFSRVSAPGGGYLSDVLFPSMLAAVGLGFAFVSVTIGAVAGTSEQDAGLASGLINTSQQVGGALGLAILAAIANAVTDHSTATSGLVALNDGFRTAFLVGAGFALTGALLAGLLIDGRDSRAAAEAAARGEAPAAVAA